MATNVEKIWEFKDPEALAQALANKSKETLAKRVRDIASQVQWNSSDLREELKKNLTESEQIDIRNTLPWTWIDTVFTKWITTADVKDKIWKTVIAWVVWTEIADMAEKWEGYFKNLSDAWETAGKLFDEWKYMAAIGVFLKWLFGGFSLKEWNKIGEEKVEWGKKEEDKKWNDKLKETEYSLWLKTLYIISWKEGVKQSNDVLLVQQIREKSFSQLEKESKSKSWITQRLKIPTGYNDDQVSAWIQIILDNEKVLDNICAKTNKDWKNVPIEDIIIIINKRWWQVFSKMKEKISGLELSATSPIGNIEKIFGSLSSMIVAKYEWWKISFWDLWDVWDVWEREKLIAWVHETTLVNIFSNTNTPITTNTPSTSAESSIAWQWDENDKKFIRDLYSFKDNIIPSLSNLFPKTTNDQGDIKKFFDEKWFTLKELFELYLITWWKTDINSLDNISKTLLYIKFRGILSKNHTLWWVFDTEILKALSDESESLKMPQEAKNIFNHILQSTAEKLVDMAWDTMKHIWGVVKSLSIEKQLMVWWAIASFILLVFFSRWLLTKALLSSAIVVLITALFAICKVELEKAWLNQETLTKWLNDDVVKAWRVWS